MLTTILDLETNAAYTRERIAEIRGTSRDAYDGPAVVISRRRLLEPLRVRLGAGLIAAGERLSGVSMSRRPAPSPSRVSIY